MEEDGFRILKVSHLDNEERHEAASRPWSFLNSWWALQLIFLQLVTEGGYSLPLIGSLLALLLGTLFLGTCCQVSRTPLCSYAVYEAATPGIQQATGDLDYARG